MPVKIIAVVNHKGGVGKTTTTLNLGRALSLQKKKVLIIDTDPQANLSQSVGIEDTDKNIYHALCEKETLPVLNIAPGFDLVPASLDLSGAEVKLISELNGYFRLKEALAPVVEQYDFILIDCPPSLGILTINALIAADKIMIIIQAQYLAIKGLNTILDTVEELRRNLNSRLTVMGMLLTQVNRTVVSKTITESIRDTHHEKVFNTVIRQSVSLIEASTTGQDIFSYDRNSHGAEDYLNLAKEILN
ncbi:MAG: ParA family protein [Bacteroidia bacterium]|nr:ParA family protein [Bacteroidia bacterium]